VVDLLICFITQIVVGVPLILSLAMKPEPTELTFVLSINREFDIFLFSSPHTAIMEGAI
jgi:hypothetical protein